MPTWSLMELEFCRHHLFPNITSDMLQGKYICCGVSRMIFSTTTIDDEKYILQSVIFSRPLADVVELAHNICAGHFDKSSHRILHLKVNKDENAMMVYKYPTVAYASRWVAQVVYDQAKRDTVLSVLSIMANMAKHRPLHGTYGQIFESFCHAELSSGKTFIVKSLTNGRESKKTWKCKINTFKDLSKADLETLSLFLRVHILNLLFHQTLHSR